MKVGILTFPNSKSYGAVLQMFATYMVCQERGYDAEIINYHNAWMKQEKHFTQSNERSGNFVWLKKKISNLLHIRMIKGFSKFEENMIKYPKRPIVDKQQLRHIGNRYSAVICGSDQVWNPDITNYDVSYFLDFCGADTSRISYAPSFGVEEVSEEFGEKIKGELEQFDAISVREEAGQKIVRSLIGVEPQRVIDPTLLIDAEQWRKYESKHPQAEGDYILYYTIRSSDTLWKYCLDLAQKTNMKILRIGSNVISKRLKAQEGMEYVSDVTPDEWLYLVRNAKYVVTNSFHGTAFSINFRRNFYVEFSSLTNSRLENIVKMLGLEDRVLSEGKEIVPGQTDYTKTEAVLPGIKEESLTFLLQALENACRKNGEQNA